MFYGNWWLIEGRNSNSIFDGEKDRIQLLSCLLARRAGWLLACVGCFAWEPSVCWLARLIPCRRLPDWITGWINKQILFVVKGNSDSFTPFLKEHLVEIHFRSSDFFMVRAELFLVIFYDITELKFCFACLSKAVFFYFYFFLWRQRSVADYCYSTHGPLLFVNF